MFPALDLEWLNFPGFHEPQAPVEPLRGPVVPDDPEPCPGVAGPANALNGLLDQAGAQALVSLFRMDPEVFQVAFVV